MFQNLIYFVGIYALLWYFYENLKSPILLLLLVIKEKFFGSKSEIDLKERYGEWAAITGASDGIGKAYAREMARRGLNIVLIARNESKLKAVAEEISLEMGVKTKIIIADFSQGLEVYDHIDEQLQAIPVGILVNNVGCNTADIGMLAASPSYQLWQVLHTNMAAVTLMSRLMARQWHESGTKGCIVNISSGTEILAVRYGALYSASKAFTRTLTLALRQELQRYGIEVQLVSPGFVVTKINSYSKLVMAGSLFIPDVETYARYAVNTIGHLTDTTGYPRHGLMMAMLKSVPLDVRSMLINSTQHFLFDKKPNML